MTDGFMYFKNGWIREKTLSNGWTFFTNWKFGSKEYRSPCGDFKVERQRDGSWRLMQKSTYRDGSPCWKRIVSMDKPARCIRSAEKIIKEQKEANQ